MPVGRIKGIYRRVAIDGEARFLEGEQNTEIACKALIPL
jgi:hypothetical protein